MNDFTKAVIYARYSSDKQTEESIEAQVRACREYAVAKDLSIAKIYADEAISGKGSKTGSRKQYQVMLKDAAKGLFDIILIHKYDRIARNVGEHVNLELRLQSDHVQLIAVAQNFGNSKEAKIMKTMMWALSEYYIDNLSDEVKKGHKEIALQALHNGGYAPFGYDIVNQRYVINEIEAKYVCAMFDCALHKVGFTGLIADMEDAGITGKRGRPIKYPQIYEILRNEKYTGTYLYSQVEEDDRALRRNKPHAIRIENALPTIIDRALFERVQEIMSERKQSGRKSSYLCSGLVYCAHCGAKMHGATTHRKGHEYQIYTCSAHCGAGVVDMHMVDRTVRQYLYELLSDENQKVINDTLREYAHNEKDRVRAFNEKIRKQAEEKQKLIDNYMLTLGSGALPKDVITDIGDKIVSLKNEIQALQETPIPKDYTVKQISDWLKALRASIDEQQTVELLVERIDADKTEVNVISTLASVVNNNGCGGPKYGVFKYLFARMSA